MINEDILNSTSYQTYYAYASGAKEPKKVRKFKKHASPKLKTFLVLPKEPTKKLGKAKKYVTLTKKTTTKPKPTKKKALVKADRGKGLNVLSEVMELILNWGFLISNNARSQGDSGEEDNDGEDDNDDGDDSDGNDDDDDDDNNDDAEELYKDVNVNLKKEDVEMTDADQGGADQHNVFQESWFEQEEGDAHVTLTAVHDTQKTKGPMAKFLLSNPISQ
ncbi:hypothetical protein Tco_0513642 [Tanacetum coccineum]